MSSFNGPVFIVGLPRSGTKLLRDLLNQNPRIRIPEVETHFIPYLVRKYGVPPRFEREGLFHSFSNELRQSMFFRYMQEQGHTFNPDDLVRCADLREWSSIFEYLLRSCGPNGETRDVIFGDKTPDYLEAMDLLKEVFPAARFLHIIRDPRDCCLSAARAWGLHPYRTADRWQRIVKAQRGVGRTIGDYMEIRYEDLILGTEEVLRSVCQFLECDYVPEMLYLSRSNEKTGDARGRTDIISDNMNKFWEGFSERQIRRVEEIAYYQMLDLGYKIYLAEGPRPLKGGMSHVLRGRNFLAFLRWKAGSRGLVEAVLYFLTRKTRRM